MEITIEHGSSGVPEELLACLDAEFIRAKGRSLSCGARYPGVFAAANLENVYVAQVQGAFAATIITKHFMWFAEEQWWRGAMVGFVYTRPQYRGQGLASHLLQTVQEDLASHEVDFGVLWTTVPSFYQRLGWTSNDRGCFGEREQSGSEQRPSTARPWSLDPDLVERIRPVQARWQTNRVQRTNLDYLTVPLPAESVEVFIPDTASDVQGYALVGKAKDVGFVYEIVGNPIVFEQLWDSIIHCYEKVYVNGHPDQASSQWLNEHATIMWRRQNLAMWKAFSVRARQAFIGNWYIPYFDRM